MTNPDAQVCRSPMLEDWLRYVKPITRASRWLWIDVVSVGYRLQGWQAAYRQRTKHPARFALLVMALI